MKKILLLIITCLFIPNLVIAKEGISNYYIDATVMSNGDLEVSELFVLTGDYNGFERVIDYKGTNTSVFDGSAISFNGSTIYNADDIIINSVKAISYDSNLNFNYIKNEGTAFEEVSFANSGDFGYFTVEVTYSGKRIRIFNPSSKGDYGFYINYTIKNLGIVHNDLSEYGWNIFTSLTEPIEKLEAYIHIPNNKELLRGWAHGPLVGNITLVDKETIKIDIEDVYANNAIDTRFVFDKNILSNSTKISGFDAFEKIIEVETVKADEANQLREEARAELAKQEVIKNITDVLKFLWFFGVLVIINKVYKKYDKEYTSEFKTKYYRDFPSDKSPSEVGYLVRKSVTNDDLSSSILMLIYKKIITFEPVVGKKKDYLFKFDKKGQVLSDTDEALLDFLFDGADITLSELKKRGQKNYEKFIKKYTVWKNKATDAAIKNGFYEKNEKVKVLTILYSVLGLIISFYTGYFNVISSLLIGIVAFGSLIYFASFKRRTKEANTEYLKWNGLKKFMEDFGRIDKKDLPEIILWEKYLVYAVTLGCANKLSKAMEIRVKEFDDFSNSNFTNDLVRLSMLNSLNNTISSGVKSSVQAAYSAQSVANSSNSSGSGFGGGFSSGGGSFGGGGGGGRF